MNEIFEVLRALVAAQARFVIIGGVALQLQGSSYITEDIDVCYEQTRDNTRRIARAIEPFAPRLRGLPKDLPNPFDAQVLMSADVVTLETTIGDLDLLANVQGIGRFSEVNAFAETIVFESFSVRVLTVEGLIIAKRAANRAKDIPGLIELEAILEARKTNRPDQESGS